MWKSTKTVALERHIGCHHGSGGGTGSPIAGILRLPRSARRVLPDAKSLPTDAEPGRWRQRRQHLQCPLAVVPAWRRTVRRSQVGGRWHGQEHGCRAGPAGDPGQRHLTGSAEHADLAGPAERRAEPRSMSRLLEAEHPHRAVSSSRRRSANWRRFCCVTTAPRSRGPTCSPTVA